MGNSYKIIVFSLFSVLLFISSAYALTFTGFTDKFNYKINETINYTGAVDQNLTSTVSIYLLNSTGTQFNFTSLVPNATNFTAQLNATVPRSGEYFVKANFTFNSTYFESSSIVKISRAHSTGIATNKPAYSPGETINFTVRTTDANGLGISDESVTIRLLYSANGTVLNSTSGSTNSAGEYSGNFLAPNALGTFRLTVNDWVAVKLVDVSTFDLVAFTGDSNANIKSKFSTNDTVFVYMDLFDSNKTRYTGTETISLQVTYPNGTSNNSVSYTFSGSRLNTSFAANVTGVYNVKVTVVSTSKSITMPVEVGKYEIVGWLERNSTATTNFFANDAVNIRVKVFNTSSGEVIKTALDYPFELRLLDSSFANASSISNTSTTDTATGVRTFTFNAPNTTGLYYVRVTLNTSQIALDMKVTATLATATPVDQSYNFKNVFVGSKQTIRVLTTLSNATSQINATNVSVVSVKNSVGTDITSSLTFNTSLVDYKDGKAGLVEFSSPANAGLYFVKTLANNNFAAETVFLIRLYATCAQLDGYKWFISSNEDVNLTVRVTEAQDVGFVDALSGNVSSSGATGSFSGMYGMYDCYAAYRTLSSGSSTSGNNTANIKISITKVINTLSGEDVTLKIGNLPSNNTDNDGRVALKLSKPSGGWDGGTYVVELEARDQNDNTDKGFGSFQVKNLWINVWPKQISGQWKWYFSPNENMSFEVNSYNSTGTWYWYGQGNGVGDNCTVMGVFYQGNGIEWFWPPKAVSSSKYTWSCTNYTSGQLANGKFNLNITPSSAFDSGYYSVKVKVNTSAGISDVGDGWFSIKAYNVYVRTTSANYYDSWYRGATDNITLDIDVTYANSTYWGCYWQKCPSNELVQENLNISVKLVKYDEWKPKDYATSKYNIMFINNTVITTSTNLLTRFNDSSTAANATITATNITQNVSYSLTTFTDGSNNVNVQRESAGSNASVTISIPKNSTINSASIYIYNNTPTNMAINVSLNDTAPFYNTTNGSTSITVSFTTPLTSLLSTCSVSPADNCTIAFNVTLNSSGNVRLSYPQINYALSYNITSGSNSSVAINIPKNADIISAFYGINASTSGPFLANISLSNGTTNLPNTFNAMYLNTTWNNISFIYHLTSALSGCTASAGNCTLRFNITLNGSATVTLSNLLINYNLTNITQNTSSLYINTSSGNANLTLIPSGGRNSDSWESGYYSVAVTVDGPQGKETGTYWFEIRRFFVNLQPVKTNDVRQTAYSYGPGDTIRINVSATNKPSWLSGSYGVSLTNVPANITAMRLSYWSPVTYQQVQTPVTWTPSAINNMTTVNITPSTNLTAGNWYNLEVTLTDSDGNNQTGWASFQVKDFTFSTSTKNWKWTFNNTENITLNVVVCTGDTWWCDFNTNNYSGAAVNVTVNNLMKTDSWPYTAVSGDRWTATSVQLNSTNNGTGNITIVPTSALLGGYYSAELSARYASGSGSAVTSNVWFRIKSFTLSVSTLQWEYRMSENVTLLITPSVDANISDASISCGYWPDQTYYSLSGGTLATNSTGNSLTAGTNRIMLSPTGGRSWVSGYCSGSVTVTSSGESQTAWISFNMKALSLYVSQTKYYYLKNENIVLNVVSDPTQRFNITDMNITFYNYENNTNIVLRLGTDFTSNATNRNFTGNATINITPTGNWSFKGWYNGQLKAIDSSNAAISQRAWFYFDIRDILYAYSWTVLPGTTNYYWNYNTSSENISFLVSTFRYNSTRTNWWPYDSASGVNTTITSIERQSCSTWPCTYTNITGWIDGTATSGSNGQALLNITRSGGWASGWHYVNVRLTDTTGETATFNKQLGFWVNT